MSDVNREQVKALFLEALEKAPGDRAAFLDRICSGETTLREQVEALLTAHEDAGEFLSEVPGDEPLESLEIFSEGPGTTIGRYKLLQEIGVGGFGVVYMAEQEEPVRRKVALKVIKLGMDTKQVIARFEAERQALALMDHPNIAKVLDAGATEKGRPYFVMELVKGIPITEYCDKASLGTRERLGLFNSVCRAVQHAHQKGIIHRDLKPNNVLVTLHDGKPVAKVIDFGIAKATDRRLTEKTLFTEFRQMIGTPDYMAPEQAELSSLDIDTRADVYSLGVLLYELLTGSKPFELKTLMEKGWNEILRHIREVDPPKPSTKLSTMGEELSDVAKNRHTQPKLLGKVIRGDLDWIVMKALEKDRSRRYDSADAMALDVERHLEDQPVLATPPSALYRMRKYVRRHKVGVIATAAIFLALATGLVMALLGMAEAKTQADAARKAEADVREQVERAETSLDLLNSMLATANIEQVGDPNYTVRQMLDDFVEELENKLDLQPEVEGPIRATIADSYVGLFELEEAEEQLKKALTLIEEGEEDPTTLAHVLCIQGYLRGHRGDYRGCLESHEAGLALLIRAVGSDEPIVHSRRSCLADALAQNGRYEEAEAQSRESLRGARSTGIDRGVLATYQAALSSILCSRAKYREALEGLEEFDMSGESDLLRARLLVQKANVLAHMADHSGAETAARELVELRTRAYGADDPRVWMAHVLLATHVGQRGDFRAAERMQRVAADKLRGRLGAAHPLSVSASRSLAMTLHWLGRLSDAEEILQETLAVLRRQEGSSRQHCAGVLFSLSGIESNRGYFTEAERLIRESLGEIRKAYGERHPRTGAALAGLADIRKELACVEEAVDLMETALEIVRETYGEEHPATARCLQTLGNILSSGGLYREAKKLMERALAIQRGFFPAGHPDQCDALGSLGEVEARLGDYAGAIRLAREGLALRRKLLGNRHPHVVWTLVGLAAYHRHLARFEEAQDLLEEARSIAGEAYGAESLAVARVLCGLANLESESGDPAAGEPLAREALRIAEGNPGGGSTILEQVENALGVICGKLGKLDEAERLQRQTYERSRIRRGEDHPDTASDLGNLAVILSLLGRRDEAMELLLDCVARLRKTSPLAAVCGIRNLANHLTADGDLDKAEELHKEALAIYREAYGEDHPDYATALSDIGAFYRQGGRYEEAEETQRSALSILVAFHGKDHPAVWEAEQTLAWTLERLAGYREAEKLFRSVVAGFEQTYGPEHDSTVQASAGLGYCLVELARYSEAGPLLEKALARQRSMRPARPASLAGALGAMGNLLQRTGRHGKAVEFYREALKLRREVFGIRSSEVADNLAYLARALLDRGENVEAARDIEKAISIRREIYGPEHPYLVSNLAQLALSRLALQDFDGALETARQAVALGRLVFKEEPNRGLAVALGALSAAHAGKGQFEEALDLTKEELGIQGAVLGEDHPEYATTLNNLGTLLYRTGDLPGAIRVSEKVLAHRQRTFGDNHPATATALNNMGTVCLSAGDSTAALQHFRKALKILQNTSGGGTALQAQVHYNIANAMFGVCRFKEAELSYLNAIKVIRRLHPDGHTMWASALGGLAEIRLRERKLEEAARLTREQVEMELRLRGGDSTSTLHAGRRLAQILSAKGKAEEAVAQLKETVRRGAAIHGAEHPLTVNLRTCLAVQEAGLLCQSGRIPDAQKTLRQALEPQRALPREKETIDGAQARECLVQLMGSDGDAETLIEEALVIRLRAQGEHHPERASPLNLLGNIHFQRGDWAKSEKLYRKALACLRTRPGDTPPLLPIVLMNLAGALAHTGEMKQAEPHYREALDLARNFTPGNPQILTTCESGLAQCLCAQKKFEEACPHSLAWLELTRKTVPAGDPRLIDPLYMSGQCLFSAKRYEEAALLIDEGLPLMRKALGADHMAVRNTIFLKIRVLQETDRHPEAKTLLEERLDRARKAQSTDAPAMADTLASLGWTLSCMGKYEESETRLRECLKIRKEAIPDNYNVYSAMSLLGESLTGQRKFDEAERLLVDGFEGMESTTAPPQIQKKVRARLVALYEAWGKPNKAAHWRNQDESAPGNRAPAAK